MFIISNTKLTSFLNFLFLQNVDTNTSNSESQDQPNMSNDSDESVIFIKENFNVKYNGPLLKLSTSKASVQMRKIDITKPQPPSSKYKHIYLSIMYYLTKIHSKLYCV